MTANEQKPTPHCGCLACWLRRNAGGIGLAMAKVTTGECPFALMTTDFATPEGVGRVRLVAVMDDVFQRHFQPVLSRLEAGQSQEIQP